jgi:hypothetical protein
MDTSDYPKDHPLYSAENMKVPGLVKDEKNGKVIEFLKFVKSKAYNYKVYKEDDEVIKLKGANRASLNENKINFDGVILDGKTSKIDSYSILSKEHELHTVKQIKQVLTTFDDKRFICSNGIYTFPFGIESIADEIIYEGKTIREWMNLA